MASNDGGRARTAVSAQEIARRCVAVRLRQLTRVVTKLYNDALRPFGLTISQMNILVAISCVGAAAQGEIARALLLEKSTLSRDLERMRDRGWVTAAAGDDARTSVLGLTAAGRRLLRRVVPAWESAQAKALALLGDAEATALQRASTAVRRAGRTA